MNVYIYSGQWEPGKNTIAYFPFEDDVLDHSGNGNVLSNTQYLSKQTLGYKWQFSQGNTGTSYNAEFINSQGNAKFISIWYKVNSASGNSNLIMLHRYGISYNPSHERSDMSGKIGVYTDSSWTVGASVNGMSSNAWHHLTIGYDGSKVLISKDGVQSTLYNGSGYNFGNNVLIVGGGNNTNMVAYVSNFICEDTCWTAQKIQDYYNSTKSLYGIS